MKLFIVFIAVTATAFAAPQFFPTSFAAPHFSDLIGVGPETTTDIAEAFAAPQFTDLIGEGSQTTTKTVSRAIGGGLGAFRPEFSSKVAAEAAKAANVAFVNPLAVSE